MKMVQLAIRGIRASLGRLILTTIAIVAGVGFVAGAFIIADSLENTFSGIFEQANSGIDAQVQVAELEFGDDERTISDSLTAEIEGLPEVGEAVPGVTVDANSNFRPFVVLDSDDNPVEPVTGGPIITFSWNGDTDEDALSIVAGQPPVGENEFAVDSAYAELAEIEVGDLVTLSTPSGEADFTLATIIDVPISAGALFVLFDFPTAQLLYDKVGQVDSIALTRAPGVTTDDMIAAVGEVIPEQATVIGQQELIEEQSAQFELVISIIRNGLLAFAGISLFVSLFIIYNTFAILVSQRLQQIGMLRAIGATKGQIRISVIVEALLVGLVGSAIGIAFGFVVAFLIKTIFQAGGGFPETGTVLALRTIIVSLLVGVVATLLSALLPAFLAGRISPVAAMRNEAPARSSTTRRTIIGSVVLGIGLILLGLGLFGGADQGVQTILTELALGAILTFIGVALLSVLFAGPIVDFIGRSWFLGIALFGMGVALPVIIFTIGDGVPSGIVGMVTFVIKMFVSAVAAMTGASILLGVARGGRAIGIGGSAAGLEGRMARQNAARSPQRTAATATALTIGIALVSTVGVVGESLKVSVGDTLDRAIRADLFIFDESGGAFSGEVADRLEEVDGLGAVSRFRSNDVWIPSDPATIAEIDVAPGATVDVDSFTADGADLEGVEGIAAYDATTAETLLRFDLEEGSTEGLLDNGILVFTDEAEDRNLAIGDEIVVVFPDSQAERLPIVGIFADDAVLNSPWVIDMSLYESHIENDDDIFVAASIAEGADAVNVKASVDELATGFSSIEVQDTEEFLGTQESQIDGLISLINWLLAFALVVAFLGVINTIVLSVIERTREIGLLRAVGMTRAQARSTIRWESVIVCLFGALLGIVLGVLFAWAAVSAIPDGIIAKVAVPYETILFAILFAALAGVVAAVLPARRAAKLNVLDAIATGGT